jgi:GLPGLI family protein
VSYVRVENNREKIELMEEKYKHLNQDIKKDFAEMINFEEFFVLNYENGESIFFLDQQKSQEIKDSELNFSNISVQVIHQKSKINPRIYKNLSQNRLLELKDVFGNGFIINDTLSINWQNHSEKKTISGKICVKATTVWNEMEVEAWYAEDIPVADGPDIFSGLPGLILELKTNKYNYTATEVLHLNTPVIISKPTDYPEMSRNEFDKMYSKKIKQMYPEGSSITIY